MLSKYTNFREILVDYANATLTIDQALSETEKIVKGIIELPSNFKEIKPMGYERDTFEMTINYVNNYQKQKLDGILG